MDSNSGLVSLMKEESVGGRRVYTLPPLDIPVTPMTGLLPLKFQRSMPADLPELSELDLTRHFTRLSQLNFCVDTNFYPLGSCTMKYNPKLLESLSGIEGFGQIHPLQEENSVHGLLALLAEFEHWLSELTGMSAFTLQPAAGAHGELTALLIARAYFQNKGEPNRRQILIPASAHGTNPASASLSGFNVLSIPTDNQGQVIREEIRKFLGPDTALVMFTFPNTLGVLETELPHLADLIHQQGALLYLDGANFNALIGVCRPGDFGFDLMHLNLHKTLATPHGGGGPGSGPVGVSKELTPFLPIPRLTKSHQGYRWSDDFPLSIGRVRSFFGNIGVILRAYYYLRLLGRDGLPKVSSRAVLNANYIQKLMADILSPATTSPILHECVFSAKNLLPYGIRALDIAKRLLDYGFHPPTVYFPLIVEEALMIEPTETESKKTLDQFVNACREIIREAKENPERLKNAPQNLPLSRLDEVQAARQPVLRW